MSQTNLKINQTPLKNTELSYFCSQMALVLHSGISTLEGLSMMREDSTEKNEELILANIITSMEGQGFLYQALEDVGVFPQYMINMVRIGEETGTLDDVMEALTRHYEREESIRTSVSHAVTYPLIMSGMILAVILVLLIRVMPIFSQVFASLGTEMTGIASVLVNIGDTISKYSIVFIGILVAIIIFIVICVRTSAGKKIARIFGGVRSLSLLICAGRFADGMSLTLKSGLDPNRSFELVSSLNSDPIFAKKLSICKAKMDEGEGLTDALYQSGIFSGIYSRMINIGSKAGAMDDVMNHIADLYEEEIDTKINNLLAIIEPALIVVLSLIVGIILMSVMFPLLGVMSSL